MMINVFGKKRCLISRNTINNSHFKEKRVSRRESPPKMMTECCEDYHYYYDYLFEQKNLSTVYPILAKGVSSSNPK